MNRADRLVSDQTEFGREKEHTRKALKVNEYLDWVLAISHLSDQLDSVHDGAEEEKGVEEEAKEVEQSSSYHKGNRSSTSTSGQEEVPSGTVVYMKGISWNS